MKIIIFVVFTVVLLSLSSCAFQEQAIQSPVSTGSALSAREAFGLAFENSTLREFMNENSDLFFMSNLIFDKGVEPGRCVVWKVETFDKIGKSSREYVIAARARDPFFAGMSIAYVMSEHSNQSLQSFSPRDILVDSTAAYTRLLDSNRDFKKAVSDDLSADGITFELMMREGTLTWLIYPCKMQDGVCEKGDVFGVNAKTGEEILIKP